MTIRETSIAVYREIVEQGLVSRIQERVLEVLAHAGNPMTVREIATSAGFTQANSVSPAMAPLVRRGAVRESGKRSCTESGRTAITFELTGNLPTPRNRIHPTDPVTWKGRALAAEKEVMRLRQKYGELPFGA